DLALPLGVLDAGDAWVGLQDLAALMVPEIAAVEADRDPRRPGGFGRGIVVVGDEYLGTAQGIPWPRTEGVRIIVLDQRAMILVIELAELSDQPPVGLARAGRADRARPVGDLPDLVAAEVEVPRLGVGRRLGEVVPGERDGAIPGGNDLAVRVVAVVVQAPDVQVGIGRRRRGVPGLVEQTLALAPGDVHPGAV